MRFIEYQRSCLVAVASFALILPNFASGDTLVVQNGQSVAGDPYAGTETSWIHSGVPNDVVGTNPILRIGYQTGGSVRFRSLIRFGQLSTYAGITPEDLGFNPNQITGATLTLYKRGNSVGDGSAELHILDAADQSWTESFTTWNQRRTDLGQAWSQGPGIGNAYGPIVGAAQPFDDNDPAVTPITFDLSSNPEAVKLVKDWFTGINTSGTFLLKATAESGAGDVYYDWYSENQNAGNEQRMPKLTVTWDPNIVIPEFHAAGFGRDWVRSRPLNVFALGGTSSASLYQGLNFNAHLAQNAAQASAAVNLDYTSHALPATDLIRGQPLSQSIKNTITSLIGGAGDGHAIMLTDEPELNQLSDLGDVAAWVRQMFPQTLVYTNSLPVGAVADPDQYIDQLVATVRPDILMHDQYPVTTAGLDRNQHFANATFYREKGLEHGLPNYAYIQAFQLAPGHGEPSVMPSESQLRMMLYSYMAAGFKGFAYFKYNTSTSVDMALLDTNGNAGPLYAPAAAANAEVVRLGTALRFLESSDLRFIPGSTAPAAPTGLTDWSPGAGGDLTLLSAAVDVSDPANQGTGKDGLIGYFTDDDGDRYFMLTNLYEGNALSASAATLDFVLDFADNTDAIYRLNRLSGVPERVDLDSNDVLNLTLPGGTGDLFKFDDGYFPDIIPGDADLDGDVDLSDLGALATYYGQTSNVFWTRGDFDLDNDVDLSDLGVLATNYGAGAAQAFADFQALTVPEPSSAAVLLMFGALGAARCRRFIGAR